GCEVAGDRVTCDVGLANAGDACTREGNHACSADRKAMLECRGGAFRAALRCGGAKGCVVGGAQIDCDDSIAAAGDACDQAGDLACSADAKSMLVCKAHAYALARACRSRCQVDDGKVA